MKINVVIASINQLTNLESFKPTFAAHECRLLVIDEGDETIRRKNDLILSDIPHEYYGPKEREMFFRSRFGSSGENFLSVIPKRCHAETSFGFLVSYEEQPDLVIEIDDDVFLNSKQDFVLEHANNLFDGQGVLVRSKNGWYNTMDNLVLNTDARIFPRGHPYSVESRTEKYTFSNDQGNCVLNMGLWIGNPDLDAVTILSQGGLDGRCKIEAKRCIRSKVCVGKGTYFAVCSMNTAFVPKVIPAFYQLYLNYLDVDRFDDIWSGLVLKKIADNLEDRVSLGEPIVLHRKRPRNVFGDLTKELEGMIINEKFWKIINKAELDNIESYFDGYRSLINSVSKQIDEFESNIHKKILIKQLAKMRLWLRIMDRLL